jgi:hypothetical protein
MTDYRKLYREAATILTRLDGIGALNYAHVTDDDIATIGQVRAIPKRGNPDMQPGKPGPRKGKTKQAK